MRIVGGEARSRVLKAPPGMETRPTLDQVRESLFNILQFRIKGKKVLDLYAGSGALALEALSRGAASAVLCDNARAAAKVITENIASLHYENRARLLFMQDLRALEMLAAENEKFDLIFLDPPYKMNTSDTLRRIAELNLLSHEGMMIVEHTADNPPDACEYLELQDVRSYRTTRISFFMLKENAPNDMSLSRQL